LTDKKTCGIRVCAESSLMGRNSFRLHGTHFLSVRPKEQQTKVHYTARTIN